MSKDGSVGIEADRVSRLNCAGCQKTLDVSHLPSFSEINCPECGTRQIVPAQFGGFLLINKLGSGGMGVIYHAMDKELGRQVALKVMKKSLGEDAEFVQSFKHEAQAAAALNHRNVVQIYSFGQVKGQPYIVMELVAGGRLDEMIAGGKPMDEERALAIHLEVTEGLNAASDVGLIHSDIKPANILFGQGGEAKVVDFGLASFIGQHQQGGQIWGTPYYIAPEKARGKKVDFRSDIYSLGATLFHVLAGQPPFDGATPTDVVLARLNHPAPSLHDFREDVHPETVALVARMLEPDPSMRYPSYPALLLDMRAAHKASRILLKKNKGSKSGVLKNMSSILPAPGRRDIRKVMKIAALATVVVLVLAGGAAGWIMHQKKQARLADELAARQRLEAALEQGQSAWNRIGALVEHIGRNAEKMPALEEKVWERAPAIMDRHPSATLALMEIDRFNENYNEAEDLFAMAWLKQQDLPAAANTEKAEACAAQLESIADKLALIYQMIDIPYEAAQKQAKEMDNYYGRIQAAERQSRQRTAEAEARRREELAAKKKAEEEAREAEKRRPIILQQEYDAVEAARGDNAPLVVRRQFKAAAQAMTKMQAGLTLPETQAYCQSVIDTYQQLDNLMSLLIKIIKGTPYPQGWSTTGGARDIVGADESGISVSLGRAGAINIKWEQVTVQQMLGIVVYYLKTLNMPNAERADLMLATALLCYETGAFKPAETLIAEIIKITPDRRPEIDRLLPGLAE